MLSVYIDQSLRMDKMDNLWNTACTTVMPYFLNEDLPDGALQVNTHLNGLKMAPITDISKNNRVNKP
jgi:hypothetical protein